MVFLGSGALWVPGGPLGPGEGLWGLVEDLWGSGGALEHGLGPLGPGGSVGGLGSLWEPGGPLGTG